MVEVSGEVSATAVVEVSGEVSATAVVCVSGTVEEVSTDVVVSTAVGAGFSSVVVGCGLLGLSLGNVDVVVTMTQLTSGHGMLDWVGGSLGRCRIHVVREAPKTSAEAMVARPIRLMVRPQWQCGDESRELLSIAEREACDQQSAVQ